MRIAVILNGLVANCATEAPTIFLIGRSLGHLSMKAAEDLNASTVIGTVLLPEKTTLNVLAMATDVKKVAGKYHETRPTPPPPWPKKYTISHLRPLHDPFTTVTV